MWSELKVFLFIINKPPFNLLEMYQPLCQKETVDILQILN